MLATDQEASEAVSTVCKVRFSNPLLMWPSAPARRVPGSACQSSLLACLQPGLSATRACMPPAAHVLLTRYFVHRSMSSPCRDSRFASAWRTRWCELPTCPRATGRPSCAASRCVIDPPKLTMSKSGATLSRTSQQHDSTATTSADARASLMQVVFMSFHVRSSSLLSAARQRFPRISWCAERGACVSSVCAVRHRQRVFG